jgi:RNA polymerase sigma-70 factor, ECF subfamily
MISATHMKRQRILLTAGYDDFGVSLKRYARSRTHNLPLTDDLIQDTFLKTWKYLVKGGKIEIMEAFLYHILKALIIDEYRKRKATSLDVLIEKGFSPTVDTTLQHNDILDGTQAIALIGELPPLYQKVMRLRYIQDLSIAEISLITGKSRNTVAVQTHRGLEKLKVLYREKAAQMHTYSVSL